MVHIKKPLLKINVIPTQIHTPSPLRNTSCRLSKRWLHCCSFIELWLNMGCSPPGSPVHGVSRQEDCSGWPFPSPGDLPNPGIEPTSLVSPAWQADSLQLSHRVKDKVGPLQAGTTSFPSEQTDMQVLYSILVHWIHCPWKKFAKCLSWWEPYRLKSTSPPSCVPQASWAIYTLILNAIRLLDPVFLRSRHSCTWISLLVSLFMTLKIDNQKPSEPQPQPSDMQIDFRNVKLQFQPFISLHQNEAPLPSCRPDWILGTSTLDTLSSLHSCQALEQQGRAKSISMV